MIKQLPANHSRFPAYISSNKHDFDSLYNDYAPALYGCILNWVKDEKLAVQILEQSFIEIWRKCQSVDCIPGRIFPWMYAICKKISLSLLNDQ